MKYLAQLALILGVFVAFSLEAKDKPVYKKIQKRSEAKPKPKSERSPKDGDIRIVVEKAEEEEQDDYYFELEFNKSDRKKHRLSASYGLRHGMGNLAQKRRLWKFVLEPAFSMLGDDALGFASNIGSRFFGHQVTGSFTMCLRYEKIGGGPDGHSEDFFLGGGLEYQNYKLSAANVVNLVFGGTAGYWYHMHRRPEYESRTETTFEDVGFGNGDYMRSTSSDGQGPSEYHDGYYYYFSGSDSGNYDKVDTTVEEWKNSGRSENMMFAGPVFKIELGYGGFHIYAKETIYFGWNIAFKHDFGFILSI